MHRSGSLILSLLLFGLLSVQLLTVTGSPMPDHHDDGHESQAQHEDHHADDADHSHDHPEDHDDHQHETKNEHHHDHGDHHHNEHHKGHDHAHHDSHSHIHLPEHHTVGQTDHLTILVDKRPTINSIMMSEDNHMVLIDENKDYSFANDGFPHAPNRDHDFWLTLDSHQCHEINITCSSFDCGAAPCTQDFLMINGHVFCGTEAPHQVFHAPVTIRYGATSDWPHHGPHAKHCWFFCHAHVEHAKGSPSKCLLHSKH